MRRELILLFLSAILLAGAFLFPSSQTQGHPFCEHDVCRTEQSERTGELRGRCIHNDFYATNCMMTGVLCDIENCDPE